MTKIGVVMDPIGSIYAYKDTTLALLLEAQRRGWDLHYMEQNHLFLRDGKSFAHMHPLRVKDDNADWFELGDLSTQPLSFLDVILMRKDPPFDMEYVYTTYLLEQAQQEGVLVVNKPQSLRDANEKMFSLVSSGSVGALSRVARSILRSSERGSWADTCMVIAP